jgi:hypothetical protein
MAAKKKSAAPATSEALHHPPVDPATPEHPFDDAMLDVAAEGAFEAVSKTDGKKHEALIAAWVARRNAAAVAAIAQRDDAPSTARKAARRAINVLKSRGVPVPERTGQATFVQKPEYNFEARAMFPDGRGAQIWWIAKIAKTGGTDVVEVTTVDRLGVVSINRGNPSAGNLRQIWNGWVGRAGRSPSEVPVEFARRRIAEARAMSVARKAVLPMGIDGAKELLGDLTTVGAAPPHPLDGEDLVVPSADDAVKARLERSMHLHEEPEYSSWLPDDPAGVALLQSINERVTTLGIIPGTPPDEEQQKKIDTTVNEAIEEAANAYFDDEKKKLYVGRLKDAAWSLYKAGLIDRAVDSLIVGQAIERAGVISDRPSEIPFVRGMFVKLIAIAQQRAAAMAPSGTEEADRLQG